MFSTDPTQRENIYKQHLQEIAGVSLTARELDIVACVFHTRGEKKIASILDISYRTVSTHMRNILNKFCYNSREQIIDTIEKSGQIQYLKEYYVHLSIYYMFIRQLKKIKAIINRQTINCVINFDNSIDEKQKQQLKDFLYLANIKLCERVTDNVESNAPTCFLYLVGSTTNFLESNQEYMKKPVGLLFDHNIQTTLLENLDYIDFRHNEDYYCAMFHLIEKIISAKALGNIVEEFTSYYHSMVKSIDGNRGNNISTKHDDSISELSLKALLGGNTRLVTLLVISVLVVITVFIAQKLYHSNVDPSDNTIRSALKIPNKKFLLARAEIKKAVDNAFAADDPIVVIALTGIGGSGKTTIARSYAEQFSGTVVWEINAENNDTIMSSFFKLAYSLAQNEEEKKALHVINDVINIKDKEDRLLQFVAHRLKQHDNWLLIYDDVSNLKDIEAYLAYDYSIWGHGKVIITSRNHNIANNILIKQSNVISISELSISEREEIFDQVLKHDNAVQKNSVPEKLALLEKLPPFPLDIITAAFYIRANNISYKDYLMIIDKHDFASHAKIQERLMQDIGIYNQTRYNIITSSLEKILKEDSHYQNLLLLISLINHHDIPKQMLIMYKGDVIADTFLHALRRYSLIINERTSDDLGPTFSIHPAIQELMLYYFRDDLHLCANSKLIDELSDKLAEYILFESEKQAISTKKVLLLHLKEMFKQKDILTDKNKIKLGKILAQYYRYTANYDYAKLTLENVISTATKYYPADDPAFGELLGDLGIIYRVKGDYYQSMQLFKKSIDIIAKKYGTDHIKLANYYTRLGHIYFYLGDCQESIKYLKASIKLANKHYGHSHEDPLDTAENNKTIITSIHLSKVYIAMGQYDKAQAILNKYMNYIKQYYGDGNYRTADVFAAQGLLETESSTGNYDEAKDLNSQALAIMINCYGDQHFTSAWHMRYLAQSYIRLQNYVQAEKLLQQALMIMRDTFAADHIEVAHILCNLGQLYLSRNDNDKNDLKEAEKMLEQSLSIYTNSEVEHYQLFNCLEQLSELNIKLHNTTQVKKYLTESLRVAKRHFPEDSAHIKRLEEKLKLQVF